MVGLVLIALGTGGIKPCVAAFGGDQFEDHQVRSTSASDVSRCDCGVCVRGRGQAVCLWRRSLPAVCRACMRACT